MTDKRSGLVGKKLTWANETVFKTGRVMIAQRAETTGPYPYSWRVFRYNRQHTLRFGIGCQTHVLSTLTWEKVRDTYMKYNQYFRTIETGTLDEVYEYDGNGNRIPLGIYQIPQLQRESIRAIARAVNRARRAAGYDNIEVH